MKRHMDTAHAHRGPKMTNVYSVSGRKSRKRMGYDDKGRGRNSSMGRSFGKRNFARG